MKKNKKEKLFKKPIGIIKNVRIENGQLVCTMVVLSEKWKKKLAKLL